MTKIKIILISFFLVVLLGNVTYASTLSIGIDTYKLKITNLHPYSSLGDISLISLGYGQDKNSGIGVEIFSANQSSGIEVEYQFIPEALKRGKQEFNYAAKIGAVSGDFWDDKASGIKLGFVIENKISTEKEIYFDADIINSSGIVIDSELGFCGQLAEGVMGVLGYKVVTNREKKTVQGTHYGIKIDF